MYLSKSSREQGLRKLDGGTAARNLKADRGDRGAMSRRSVVFDCGRGGGDPAARFWQFLGYARIKAGAVHCLMS